jgi:alpha-tubulin suppressor-like RCC1 family protein
MMQREVERAARRTQWLAVLMTISLVALVALPRLATATRLAAGQSHTCALTAAGGVQCWGDNSAGQLGDGTMIAHLTPADVTGLTSGATAVVAGSNHTCSLTAAGGVKCWGYNAAGQLGDGTTTDRLIPVDVTGLSSGVTALAAGQGHTCALTLVGGVKCWGDNAFGDLGEGTTTTRTTPVDVTGLSSGLTALAAGSLHTCALTAVGGVKCWGYNGSGQLGDGTTTNHTTPVDVTGLPSGATMLAAGGHHTCVTAAGLECWGDNALGALGDGTTTNRTTPVDVTGLSVGVTAVVAGGGHTCALTAAGGLKCWGNNGSGQLGDGSVTNRVTAVDVMGLSSGMATLAAGGYHTCAAIAAGLKCWGNNFSGELGDGTQIDRSTPVSVIGLWGANVVKVESSGFKCNIPQTPGNQPITTIVVRLPNAGPALSNLSVVDTIDLMNSRRCSASMASLLPAMAGSLFYISPQTPILVNGYSENPGYSDGYLQLRGLSQPTAQFPLPLDYYCPSPNGTASCNVARIVADTIAELLEVNPNYAFGTLSSKHFVLVVDGAEGFTTPTGPPAQEVNSDGPDRMFSRLKAALDQDLLDGNPPSRANRYASLFGFVEGICASWTAVTAKSLEHNPRALLAQTIAASYPITTEVQAGPDSLCGNCLLDAGETCDSNGAGCSATCQVDSGWMCPLHRCVDSCTQVCGGATCNDGAFCNGVETCVGTQQTPVVPGSAAGSEGNGAASPIPCGSDRIHQQVVIAGAQVGSGLIRELRLRQDGVTGTAFTPRSLSNVTIAMSSTTAAPDGLSTTFANNLGADVATVFDGLLTLSSAPSTAVPRPFDIVIPLATPFSFDPSGGKNLLVDFQLPTCPILPPFDEENTLGDGVSRIVALNDATEGTPDTSALVTQVVVFHGCEAGTPPAVNDGIACTADSCDESAATIVHAPNDAVCADSDVCTDDVCNVSSGCQHPFNTAPCNDNNDCTQTDTCLNDTCTGTNPVICGAAGQCQGTGICNPSTGTCSNGNQPDGNTCDDHNPCTQTDTCQSGTCNGNNPVVCTAFDQCHVAGVCDTGTGVCSNPNAPDTTPCNDGDGCPADTCQAGICQPVSCPSIDAVALAGQPVSVTIAGSKAQVLKQLSVNVRNADASDRTIGLSVDASDCPLALAGSPDFVPSTLVADTSILVRAGKTKTAKLPLTISSAAFRSVNWKAPVRCTLRLTASALVTGGSNDPNPSNNVALIELSVIDKNDAELAATHETTIRSAKATSLNIKSGNGTATKTLKAVVGNADYKPTTENPGDPITLSANTTCTGLTLSPPICDATTSSAAVTVKGGKTKTCKLTATANAVQISTTNKLSPQRCTVTLTATGPTNPQVAPLDSSNNTTELVIDVLDKNP